MDDKEFYELAVKPGFGDSMAFQIHCEDERPGVTFSIDGMDTMTDQMQRFVLARILSRMDQGEEAKDLHITLNLHWSKYDEETLQLGLPFYIADLEGTKQIDGTHRWVKERP
jgi:hypothetical protein